MLELEKYAYKLNKLTIYRHPLDAPCATLAIKGLCVAEGFDKAASYPRTSIILLTFAFILNT
jgi:hypothetical protein